MIIVADSGSTKADWKVIQSDRVESLSTMGFNPVLHTDQLIAKEVAKAFESLWQAQHAKSVYFYGSGCWDTKRKSVIIKALSQYFTQANIEVQHDLLAAARATCGTQEGIACIMGTGSNTCLFDGVQVTDNVTNLGYFLGDEGSGSHLGKKLVRAYFYRELPAELEIALEEQFPGGKMEILDEVYEGAQPNVFLASLTRFLAKHKAHFFVQRLIYSSFVEFIDRHVRKYPGHLRMPVHFIGSVAFHFQEIVKTVLEERNIQVGRFIQKPIDHLVQYHTTTAN
ncbi:MAG: hypothetical protein AAF798_16060 [Bacteroidota bacterium]